VLEQLQSKPEKVVIRLNIPRHTYFNNLFFGSPFEGVLISNELLTKHLWQRIDFLAFNKSYKNQINHYKQKFNSL